ncbi:hypothetical protein [Paracoccus marinaquae]|uniref:Uncharacterized protein n=1 Tax=Paracoccus marinaquae TaxID=2841926 RepID=A0ABS6AGI0_9RHOB|nr:hypothetical protein [Paracoccus marinaquae]MBU3028795.1 hypothetical protein [Paracoccus marinaquae]
MNANRLLNMLLRRLTNWGVGKGIDHLSKPKGDGPAALSPEQARAARKAAKRARQALRITRRFGR